eukprot:8589597-Heterocapsa_arctica.AAC.1
MGNKAYAMALESCIKDDGAKWLRENKKGDLTDCIFALAYLYQTKSCQALEGIMGLVVFLENKLRAPEITAEI